MDRFGRNGKFGRLITASLGLAYLVSLGLGLYEMTAKSPVLLGSALPGWWAAARAEKATPWNPPTGFFPVDKFLHEGEEAIKFYHFLSRPAAYRSPTLTPVS